MKERPILFAAEMVRAILDGSKTQTRRIVKPQPVEPFVYDMMGPYLIPDYPDRRKYLRWSSDGVLNGETELMKLLCPYGQPGDRLWVRETFRTALGKQRGFIYRADGGFGKYAHPWKPSIFMPRNASRITLEITNVRIERIQEGGDREFWGEEVWAANPWVWVIEFRRAEDEAHAQKEVTV